MSTKIHRFYFNKVSKVCWNWKNHKKEIIFTNIDLIKEFYAQLISKQSNVSPKSVQRIKHDIMFLVKKEHGSRYFSIYWTIKEITLAEEAQKHFTLKRAARSK